MRKITRFDNIGFDVGDELWRQGVVAVRFACLTYDDDGNLLSRSPSRTELTPDADIDSTLAGVNRTVAEGGFDPISADDVARVKALCAMQWTSEIRDAYAVHIAEVQEADRLQRESEAAAAAEAAAARRAALIAALQELGVTVPDA